MENDIQDPLKKYGSFIQFLEGELEEGDRENIAEHGADSGFHWLIYTSDTVAIFDAYEDELWELVVDTADSFGLTPLAFVDGFRRNDMVGTFSGFKNLIVWFAAEHYASLGEDNE